MYRCGQCERIIHVCVCFVKGFVIIHCPLDELLCHVRYVATYGVLIGHSFIKYVLNFVESGTS